MHGEGQALALRFVDTVWIVEKEKHIKNLTDLDFGIALAAKDIKVLKDLKRQFPNCRESLGDPDVLILEILES